MFRLVSEPVTRIQLKSIVSEFEAAQERLRALFQGAVERYWVERPDPGRWSMSECIAHLNLTSQAYLPLLRDGISRARASGKAVPRRYRMDPMGWFLWKSAGPPVRFRVKTTAAFVPTATHAPSQTVSDFQRLQVEQLAWVREADGLPITSVRITSPFDARIRYNLYACLAILPRHQHRHLWQAEQAWQTVRQRGT
jgi:hypothetical protein